MDSIFKTDTLFVNVALALVIRQLGAAAVVAVLLLVTVVVLVANPCGRTASTDASSCPVVGATGNVVRDSGPSVLVFKVNDVASLSAMGKKVV